MLPLMLDAASKKKINLKKVIELMCSNPAKRFNIYPRKGIIKKGSDADLCILDLKERWIVSQKTLVSKGKKCAHLYYGDKIKGSIKTTIISGKIVYNNKKFYKYKNNNFFVSPTLGNKI